MTAIINNNIKMPQVDTALPEAPKASVQAAPPATPTSAPAAPSAPAQGAPATTGTPTNPANTSNTTNTTNAAPTGAGGLPQNDFGIDLSKINVGNTGTPDLPGLPGADVNQADANTGPSRREMLDAAFEKAINNAKQGNTEQLNVAVQNVASESFVLEQEVHEESSRGQGENDTAETEGRRTDIFSRVTEHQKLQKNLKARLSEEAKLAEKADKKELAEFFNKQTTKLKVSHDRLDQTVQKDEAQNAFAETKDKAGKFNQLTQSATKKQKLTPKQQEALAKMEKQHASFKAGDAAGRLKNAQPAGTEAQKALAQQKKPEVKAEGLDETPDAEHVNEKDEQFAADERVEAPSEPQLEAARQSVASKVDPNVRQERAEAFKKQREKIELAKAAIREANSELPEDGAQKARAEGLKRVYRDTNRQAFDDVMGGKSSLAGVIYFGGEGRSLASLSEENASGVRGQNTAASLEGAEIKPEEAPARLAALSKQKTNFEEIPVLSLWQWNKRGERAPAVRDLQVDGISSGQVAV